MFLKEISLVGSVSAEIIPSKSLSHEDPQKVITTKILQMSTFTPVIFAEKKIGLCKYGMRMVRDCWCAR